MNKRGSRRHNISKLLAVLLCAAVAVTVVPVPTLAASAGNAAKEQMRKASSDDFVIENGVLEDYQGAGGNVKIPSGVIRVGEYAFERCGNLTSVTLPAGVKSIGASAFNSCSNLKTITFPVSMMSIEEYAFNGCSRLTSAALPAGVTYIGEHAFDGCSNLTSVRIPAGVKSIKASTFSYCSRLKSVVLPASLTSIEMYAFCGCRSLTSVTIPKSVTSIGMYAFSDCNKLTIHGFANSAAQTYAKDEGIRFAATDSAGRRKLSSAKISIKSYLYTGKAIKPTKGIVVKLNGKRLAYGRDYKATKYKNNTAPGIASVTITGIGKYTGTRTVRFKINLGSPSISKVTSPKKKQVFITWRKTKGATGYQLYRATSKKGKYKKVATIKSAKYTDKKVSRKKTYYYKLRAYRKVKGKVVYSGYSKVKSVRTK